MSTGDDVETSAKQPDHVVLAVLCDRCEAQLVVEAPTREEAREKLHMAITDARWRVTDRLEGASTMRGAQDLCSVCAKQL